MRDLSNRSRNEGALTMTLSDPRKRPFAQLAAQMLGSSNALNAGCCPTCQGEIKESDFRNEISKHEFGLSGMCQACQDSVFGQD